MNGDYLTPHEVQEIVAKLDGADRVEEERICDEVGIASGDCYDMTYAQGYEWSDDERWVKRQFPAFQSTQNRQPAPGRPRLKQVNQPGIRYTSVACFGLGCAKA